MHEGRPCHIKPVSRWPQHEEARIPTQVLYKNRQPVGYAAIMDDDGDFEMAEGTADVVTADLFKLHFLSLSFTTGKALAQWQRPARKTPEEVMQDFLTMIRSDIDEIVEQSMPSGVKLDSSTQRTLVLAHNNGKSRSSSPFAVSHGLSIGCGAVQQERLRTACTQAGFHDEVELKFAAEGEANLHAWAHNNFARIHQGLKVVVIDAGGGTVDV
jgi:hypothetical protein